MPVSRLLISCFLFIVTSKVSAATLIESRDAYGQITRVYIDNNTARIEQPEQNTYMIMDVDKKSMKVVLDEPRMVLDMSNLFAQKPIIKPAVGSDQYVDSYIKSKGLGPVIAGYETEKYEYYANGQFCGNVYVSVQAMNEIGHTKFIHALEEMVEKVEVGMTGVASAQVEQYLDPCEQTIKTTAKQLENLGFPMRSDNRDHKLQSVVTKLSRDIRLPANAFVVPKAYTLTRPETMLEDIAQQMQDMLNNLPPEEREKMMQEMMQ